MLSRILRELFVPLAKPPSACRLGSLPSLSLLQFSSSHTRLHSLLIRERENPRSSESSDGLGANNRAFLYIIDQHLPGIIRISKTSNKLFYKGIFIPRVVLRYHRPDQSDFIGSLIFKRDSRLLRPNKQTPRSINASFFLWTLIRLFER